MIDLSSSSVPLSYDAQSDRLIGGDFFRDVQDRPALYCLTSQRRAKLIYETAPPFHEAYKELLPTTTSSDTPFGLPLAVFGLPSYPVERQNRTVNVTIDELFNFPQLATAPLEYRQLCQVITLVAGYTTLQDSPVTPQPVINDFTSQLWLTLSCAHQQAGVSLTRHQGTCIKPSNLTPQGEILDIYYLTRASEARQDLVLFQRYDLAYAFYTLWRLIKDDPNSLAEVCRQAVLVYHGPGPGLDDLLALAEQTATQLHDPNLDDAQAETLVQKLAAQLHEGGRP
jgi:hypothetical protein